MLVFVSFGNSTYLRVGRSGCTSIATFDEGRYLCEYSTKVHKAWNSQSILACNKMGNAMTKILLVEDNEMNRDMLSRRLKKKGFEVTMAFDGKQGVEMASTTSPEIILLDMSLPVMDGWEAAGHLKADPATKAIPIIALTAHAMAGDKEKAMEAGCDDYDTKPVDFKRLLQKIETLLA